MKKVDHKTRWSIIDVCERMHDRFGEVPGWEDCLTQEEADKINSGLHSARHALEGLDLIVLQAMNRHYLKSKG